MDFRPASHSVPPVSFISPASIYTRLTVYCLPVHRHCPCNIRISSSPFEIYQYRINFYHYFIPLPSGYPAGPPWCRQGFSGQNFRVPLQLCKSTLSPISICYCSPFSFSGVFLVSTLRRSINGIFTPVGFSRIPFTCGGNSLGRFLASTTTGRMEFSLLKR